MSALVYARRWRSFCSAVGILTAVVSSVLATPAAVQAQLAKVETEAMRLVYVDGSESYLVPHAARTFLNSLEFQRRLFDFDPSEKITLLLVDFSDSGNAGASVVPRNVVTVQIAPLSFEFETIAANERMNTIMNHELVHIATMDQAAKKDRVFRRLFGGKVNPVAVHPESMFYFFLTTPRVAAPRWYHEGSAVFVDTWMAGGLGRAQSGYDEMVFRAMVRDDAPFYDPLGLVSEGTKIDFQLQINSYLYGTRFMTWLGRRYAPEKVVTWLSRRDGSRAYYSSAFRQVFGLSLEAAWAAWVADERAFQQENLAAIRKYPATPFRDITSRALGSVSRAYYDAGTKKIYAAFNYPGVVAHVGAIAADSGAVEKIVDIKGPVIYTVSSLAYDPDGRMLYYTTDNGAYRDLVSVDPETHRTTLLQRDARIGDLAFDRVSKSLWGIRHLNGFCSLVRIAPPYRDWARVVSWPYGTVVYDLDVSPDGRQIVAAFGEITGQQYVRVLSTEALAGGDATPVSEFPVETSVPSGFVFSPDGRFLYGSSYYTGVANIFRFEIATGKREAVTNTETGFFRPVPLGGDRLLVFRYSGQGFVPTTIEARPLEDVSPITFLGERLAAEHPIVKSWKLGSPADIAFDSMPKQTGTYRLAGGLEFESIYPVVQGYKETAGPGVRVNFSDPLQLNRASILLAVTPGGSSGGDNAERFHLDAEYQRYDWRGRLTWNRTDFYDLFGPTKTSRRGYYLEVGHKQTIVFDEPKRLDLDIEGSISGDLDQLPDYQNVPVNVDRLLALRAKLNYSHIRNSLGSVDDETGQRWSIVAEVDDADGETVPIAYATFDRGWAIKPGHASIWLRNAAGFTTGDLDSPFANFFFGGFGNNYVDHKDEKRYREYYSFAGAPLNEIPGRTFVKSTVEWNLPPLRFRHAGTPGFHAAWVRPAVFLGGLVTNMDVPDARQTAANIGAQIDIRFSLLSVLDMTVSTGAAVAFREHGHANREAMISVKILR
jgi:DNA-binding beta-propeller fold protein YncE